MLSLYRLKEILKDAKSSITLILRLNSFDLAFSNEDDEY